MEKETPEIIEDLKKIFRIGQDGNEASSENNGMFAIDKRTFGRTDVLSNLQIYFMDKEVKDGFVKVDPVTFVHTSFEIVKGNPEGKMKIRFIVNKKEIKRIIRHPDRSHDVICDLFREFDDFSSLNFLSAEGWITGAVFDSQQKKQS